MNEEREILSMFRESVIMIISTIFLKDSSVTWHRFQDLGLMYSKLTTEFSCRHLMAVPPVSPGFAKQQRFVNTGREQPVPCSLLVF